MRTGWRGRCGSLCFERSGFAKIAPMAIRCLRCGTNIQAPAQFCENCAAEQRAAGIFQPSLSQPARPGPAGGGQEMTVTCASCGAQAPAGAAFCPECGSPVVTIAANYNIVGRRILAGLVDIIILAVVLVFFVVAFGDTSTNETNGTSGADFRLPTLPFLVFVLVSYGYYMVCEALAAASIGKMLFGIQVI